MSWQALVPVGLPCGLMIAGAAIGYPFSLDPTVANERLIGLVLASLLAVSASVGLRQLERSTPLLVGAACLALLGGVWVICGDRADMFGGTVGESWRPIFFGPSSAWSPVTDSGRRGEHPLHRRLQRPGRPVPGRHLLLRRGALGRPSRWRVGGAGGGIVIVSVVLLVGTGARGGLTGLAAGICAIALYAWPRRYALLAVVAAPVVLGLAALSLLDKGLEFSSTAGRLTYWSDLARLLVEYPLTGVGLGWIPPTGSRCSTRSTLTPSASSTRTTRLSRRTSNRAHSAPWACWPCR